MGVLILDSFLKTMNIYFCGSITGGRNDKDIYKRIIQKLQTYGTVLAEHVGCDESIAVIDGNAPDSKFIHDRHLDWLISADLVVAEVTQPSLGVGYELGRASAMNKKVVCMFRPENDKKLSCMIEGKHDGSSFKVIHYSKEDYIQCVENFMISYK